MNMLILITDELQILEAYETQLRHLQKEMQLVQQEYDDWQKLATKNAESTRRR